MGTANVKLELIKNLENYENLFAKFQKALDDDNNLKKIFTNSLNNISEAKKIILSDEVTVFDICDLLEIIKQHKRIK